MHSLGVMAQSLLCKSFRVANGLGPFRPGITVTVQRDASNAKLPTYNVKFFAASELLEQVEDRAWLAKITNALNQHWQKMNAQRKVRFLDGTEGSHRVN
jgi:hypothetical protein